MPVTFSRKSRKRYQRARLRLETLEPRTMLSVTTTVYSFENMTPTVGAYDACGSLWVVDPSNGTNGTLDQIVGSGASRTLGLLIDLGGASVNSIVAGPNNTFYIADANRGIDIVSLSGTGSTLLYPFANATSSQKAPLKLAITGGGTVDEKVWFVGSNSIATDHSNIVGWWSPGSTTAQFFSLTETDAEATSISANSDNTVWVGMVRRDDVANSTNHLLNIDSSGTLTDFTGGDLANNYLTSVAADGKGGVWVALANVPGSSSVVPDEVVHGIAVNSAFVVDSTFDVGSSTESLNIHNLAIDGAGNVWCGEFLGSQAFYIANNAVHSVGYGTVTLSTSDLAVNPKTGEVSILTASTDFSNPSYAIVNITVTSAVPAFSGSANNLSAMEDTIFNNTVLATFSAPAPMGAYSATITWGDNTTTTVTPTLKGTNADGSNLYEIDISGKSYATQGVYHGSISISDTTGPVGFPLTFTSTIGDIPLNVSSVSAIPLVLRIVTVAGSFTDDGDLALSTWTATIDWGDNTTSTGLIVRDPTHPGRYIVLALHQYRTRGTYSVTLTVSTTEALAAITSNSRTTSVTAR